MKAVFVAVLFCLFAGPSAASTPTSTVDKREEATVKFVNSSGMTLRFSIDGRAGPTVQSGEQGFDTTTVGSHTFKAETLNGKQSVVKTYNVPKEGATWTITPPKQN